MIVDPCEGKIEHGKKKWKKWNNLENGKNWAYIDTSYHVKFDLEQGTKKTAY